MSKITKVFVGLGALASLGVALLPLTSYAANPENVTVNIQIMPTLAGEAICSSAGNLPSGMTAGTTVEATCTATYSANGPAAISIVDKDANTNLVGLTSNANTIPALATNANLTSIGNASAAAWGYKFAVSNDGAGGASGGLVAANANVGLYNGVSTTAVTVGSSAGLVTNAVGTFTFGVKTLTTTVADTYQDVVVIAITAGP